MEAATDTRTFDPYVPRVLLRRLATAPEEPVLRHEGTIVFVDLSGFTKLSERLARKGKEGAENVVETINACFTVLLAEAYELGGSLLKFGGDALLLWFEGDEHPPRACAAAVAMRRTLRRIGRIRTGGSEIVLRMSVGVHTGTYETFLVGDSHHEYLIAGPAASTVVQMEGAASAGQILVSRSTARTLPKRWLGAPLGPGVLLSRAPEPPSWIPEATLIRPGDEAVAACLSTAVRAHLLSAPAPPEHRAATVTFLQYGQLDEMIERQGPEVAADALDELVRVSQAAADQYEISFLNSDIAADGGKLLFSAGAPRAVGDDDERMLLAMRQILDAGTTLPIRIGVNRGHTFTGEVGPPYRRTYVVMGDVVNLAARLSAKARWGTLLTTEGVLRQSRTHFASTAVPPFMVKGKSRPIEGFEVEGAIRAAPLPPAGKRLALVGRDRELEILRTSIEAAVAGRGAFIELVGETGSGKSRLLAEARDFGHEMRSVHATCEPYTQLVPYFVWRDPLRQLLGLNWDDPDALALERLHAHVESVDPELTPWVPLLAIALGVEAPTTREVEEIALEFRGAKLQEVLLRFLAPALAIPTLVQIEHAHLMDEASASLLLALSETLASSSWVVMATRRDVPGGLVVPAESALRVELGPLTREASLLLAEEAPEAELLPPDVLEAAVERSGGSPEFLLDLLSAAAGGSGELPGSIEAATSARLDALPPGDRALVCRAAVLGLFFHPKRLEHVLPDDSVRPDADTWLRLDNVFAQDPDGHIRFKRPALREVAYEMLPFRLRRGLHAVLATALEPFVEVDVDADPAVLSMHFILAGDHEPAWRYARVAAERAVAKFAQADAARLYRRAIEAGRQDGASDVELAECWEALGQALQHSGHLAEADDAFTAARKLRAEDHLAVGRLFLRHVRVDHRRGRLASAVRWGGRGLRVLGEAEDDAAWAVRGRLLAELAYIRCLQKRPEEAERLCRRAIEHFPSDAEERPLAHASYVLDLALMSQDRLDEAVHSHRALAIYRKLGDLEEQGWVLNTLATVAHLQWDWDEALRVSTEAEDAFARAGCESGVAVATCNIGEILSDRGVRTDAKQHLVRARRLWGAHRERGGVAYADLQLGRMAGREHDVALARKLAGDAADELREIGETHYLESAKLVLAEAEALGGDPTAALDIADPLVSVTREPAWLGRIRGLAYARLGRTDEAVTELRASLTLARSDEALYEIAATLDVLLALGAGSDQDIVERDSLLARLGVQQLPALELAATARELAAALEH